VRLGGGTILSLDGRDQGHFSAYCALTYSHSGCIKLLARLGFKYRKPKPRVASAEKYTAFIAFYERLVRELPADEAVYFAPSRDHA
jgi:hypothetical protein